MSLGKKLKNILENEGCNVFMTREGDDWLPLDGRTLVANQNKSDVFISLHGNATKDCTIKGIETYFIDPYLFTNEFNSMNDADVKKIMLYKQNLSEKSKKLAHCVHKNMLKTASKFQDVVDRKVKKQAGQVLFGESPSILVECGFLSHPEECKLLISEQYQQALASSLAAGIKDFLQ